MADTQINFPAVSAAPATFRIPRSVQFVLKAVHADFTDNGAVVDWVPAVVLKSDSGDVIARAVDRNAKITAGGGASTSFFPGVKPAAAAAAATAPDYLILQGTGQTVTRPASGDSDHSKFTYATRQTNNDASWTYILDAGGAVKEVDTTVPGRYLSLCQFEWAQPVASSRLQVLANLFGTGFFGVSPYVTETTTTVWAGIVAGISSMSSGTGQMTIEPAVTSGDASIFYDADYWFILRFRT